MTPSVTSSPPSSTWCEPASVTATPLDGRPPVTVYGRPTEAEEVTTLPGRPRPAYDDRTDIASP